MKNVRHYNASYLDYQKSYHMKSSHPIEKVSVWLYCYYWVDSVTCVTQLVLSLPVDITNIDIIPNWYNNVERVLGLYQI